MKALLTTSAIALLAAIAPVAKADSIIQIQYEIDNNPALRVTCTSLPGATTDSCNPATFANNFNVGSLTASSNQPGTPGLAITTSAEVLLANNDSVAHTIQIQISADDFTNPLGFASVLSHVGGTVANGVTGSTFSFQSCVDSSNAIRGVDAGGSACPVADFASGLSAPSIATTGSYQNDQTAAIGPLVAPYSITESYFITLGAHAAINWSASTTVTPSPTPEPDSSSMLLLGSALVGLGSFAKKKFARK
jgi:hypothetical protein